MDGHGRAVQVEARAETLVESPWCRLLKLRYDRLLSTFASISTCAATPRRGGLQRVPEGKPVRLAQRQGADTRPLFIST